MMGTEIAERIVGYIIRGLEDGTNDNKHFISPYLKCVSELCTHLISTRMNYRPAEFSGLPLCISCPISLSSCSFLHLHFHFPPSPSHLHTFQPRLLLHCRSQTDRQIPFPANVLNIFPVKFIYSILKNILRCYGTVLFSCSNIRIILHSKYSRHIYKKKKFLTDILRLIRSNSEVPGHSCSGSPFSFPRFLFIFGLWGFIVLPLLLCQKVYCRSRTHSEGRKR